jgi:hypothetical protein
VPDWLPVAILLAAFLGWFVFSSRGEKVRRGKERAAFGLRHGLKPETFTVDVFGPRAVTYGEFWPDLAGEFRLGRGRVTIDNVWRGPWNGGEIRLFDFDRNGLELGRAILFESPALDLPAFVVPPYPDHPDLVDQAKGEALTLDGVVVLTREAMAVQRAFTPEVVAFFNERQEGRRTWAEGRGRRLLFYKQVAAPRRLSRPAPDFPADASDEGFWASGQTLARLLGS